MEEEGEGDPSQKDSGVVVVVGDASKRTTNKDTPQKSEDRGTSK